MKSIVILGLFSLIFCNEIINQKFVSELKQKAKFEVYSPEENPFRDWTGEEIRKMLGTKILSIEPLHKDVNVVINEGYDFRKEHPECMLGIRNQANCGSCWAFGGTTSLQERFCYKSNGDVKPILAPQDPVSCDTFNMGCNGGILYYHWLYLSGEGVVDEDCFPYTAGEGDVEPCPDNKCKNQAEWKKYVSNGFDNFYTAEDIKNDLPLNGPLETQFNVYSDFMQYKSGIYEYTSGKLEGGHAVVIVGFGSENGKNYWICQNSWGPNWGEDGYFRIKMGEVGIDSNAFGGHPTL
jgi:cathepsin B